MLTPYWTLTRPQARAIAAAWLTLIYLVTALWSLFAPTPPERWQLELRQIALHLAGYFATAFALAPLLWDKRRHLTFARLLVAALLVGIGQEALQGLIRQRLLIGASAFDLAVDLVGAALGLALLKRLRAGDDQAVPDPGP